MSDEFVSLTEARAMPGLRLVLVRGVPSPWSQAARGILRIKGIAFQKAHLAEGESRSVLQEWTRQDAFPALMFEDERPRTGWEEILFLAERLAPSPSLIPSDPEERIRMFGLARELCGEMGLGWCRRLVAMGGMMAAGKDEGARSMAYKYMSSPEEIAAAQGRSLEILTCLDAQLSASKAKGGRFLMGDELSALDVYWAAMSNLVSPLSEEQMPMPPVMRGFFQAREPETIELVERSLIAHRDFIYEEYLELPVEL